MRPFSIAAVCLSRAVKRLTCAPNASETHRTQLRAPIRRAAPLWTIYEAAAAFSHSLQRLRSVSTSVRWSATGQKQSHAPGLRPASQGLKRSLESRGCNVGSWLWCSSRRRQRTPPTSRRGKPQSRWVPPCQLLKALQEAKEEEDLAGVGRRGLPIDPGRFKSTVRNELRKLFERSSAAESHDPTLLERAQHDSGTALL